MQIEFKVPDSLAPHLIGVPDYIIRDICIKALRERVYGFSQAPVQYVPTPVYIEPETQVKQVEEQVIDTVSIDFNDSNNDSDFMDSLFR